MREMIDTGNDCLTCIPAEWQYTRLKYYCKISNGSDPQTEGDIPAYGSGKEVVKYCGEYKEGPAILLGRKGTLDNPRYIEGKFWNVDTAMDAYPINGINPRFLFFITTILDIQRYATSTAKPSMTQSDYYNMPIPIPSREEQDAIVSFVDSKCSAIDEAIERHKKIIEKLEEYWKSVVWTEINSHVDTTGKLKILFELHRGYDLTANSFVNGSVPVYGSGGLVGYHNEAKCVGPNVVIGRSGSTGKLTYIPDAVFWAHNTGIYVSDFRGNIPRYVYYLLLTIDIDSLANKTAVPTLDRKNVQNYVASFTTNTEQQNSIVDKLDVLYESIQKSKTIHEKSITKLEEYRKSIIYNAVTGKIDCRTETQP